MVCDDDQGENGDKEKCHKSKVLSRFTGAELDGYTRAQKVSLPRLRLILCFLLQSLAERRPGMPFNNDTRRANFRTGEKGFQSIL